MTKNHQESRMSGNLLVRFDEGRVGRTECVALSPTLPVSEKLEADRPKKPGSQDTPGERR